MMAWGWLAVVLLVILLVRQLTKPDAQPVLGKYSAPGALYPFKYALLFIMVHLYQWWKRYTHTDYPPHIRPFPYEERADALKHFGGGVTGDALYFNGFDTKGNAVACRMMRRLDRTTEVFLLVKLAGSDLVLTLPRQPDTLVYNVKDGAFSAAGLSFHMISPLRAWKVTYSGMMRVGIAKEMPEPDTGEFKHVKFTFTWRSMTELYYFNDINFAHPAAIAASLAVEPWSDQFFRNLLSGNKTKFQQWGQLYGQLTVDSGDEIRLRLRGMRERTHGVLDWREFKRINNMSAIDEDGMVFSLRVSHNPNGVTHLLDGYIMLHNGNTRAISSSDFKMYIFGEDQKLKSKFITNFVADGKLFKVEAEVQNTCLLYNGEQWDSVIHHQMISYKINGKNAHGVAEFQYRNSVESPIKRTPSLPLLKEQVLTDTDKHKFVVPFSDGSCTSSKLVGGKGMQLALLTSTQRQLDYIVPAGFCVTINAFNHHLKAHKQLQDTLSTLKQASLESPGSQLEGLCTQTVEEFLQAGVVEEVKQQITEALRQSFDTDIDGIPFAVRSSAAGEDGEDVSAAGQMETILSVKGMGQICSAVCKCWASHFTYTAVEYRRVHGLPVCGQMGVCIQQMVESEASGVLFTCDPLNGNSGVMIINSNYGLGESVVSGVCEPDTIQLTRTPNDILEVKCKEIGSKKMKIVSSEAGGTITVDVDDSSKYSISDEVAIRLGYISIELEKRFGSPRDVEWAVRKGQIYLLQARPITTFDMESEFELIHELDAPLLTDYEILTRENVGEVLPGALTPLTINLMISVADVAIQTIVGHLGEESDHVFPLKNGFEFTYYQGFINMMTMYASNENTVYGMKRQNSELALFGHTLEDSLVEPYILRRYGVAPLYKKIWKRLSMTLFFATKTKDTRSQVKKSLKKYVKLDVSKLSAEQIYREILEDDRICMDYGEAWRSHILSSMFVNIWNGVVIGIITKGSADWQTEHYSDVATLYSDCEEMESADVPRALKMLTSAINSTFDRDYFINMDKKEAEKKLLEDEGEAGQKFRGFLEAHGHRCVKEMEYMTISWNTSPETLVEVIQNMLKDPRSYKIESRKIVTVEEAINKLQTPVSNFSRKLLNYFVPKARHAVSGREQSKSMVVKFVDIFRQWYRRVAYLLVKEGLLPDEDLLFFLTHLEMGEFFKGPQPRLVQKAIRRRKLHPQLCELKFPEPIIIGEPIPINEDEDENCNLTTTTMLKGMPVCNGTVRAKARVITNLKDAHEIQAGEVLIVPYTDIGWSPYFPLVSGVVTELGGLLSHGAVIAREYGIPALVGVKKATVVFKSGDEVILNGSKGFIQKVETS